MTKIGVKYKSIEINLGSGKELDIIYLKINLRVGWVNSPDSNNFKYKNKIELYNKQKDLLLCPATLKKSQCCTKRDQEWQKSIICCIISCRMWKSLKNMVYTSTENNFVRFQKIKIFSNFIILFCLIKILIEFH